MQRRIIGRAKKMQVFLHQQVAILNRKKKKEGSGLRGIYLSCVVQISKKEKRFGRNRTLFPAVMIVACTWFVHKSMGKTAAGPHRGFLGSL